MYKVSRSKILNIAGKKKSHSEWKLNYEAQCAISSSLLDFVCDTVIQKYTWKNADLSYSPQGKSWPGMDPVSALHILYRETEFLHFLLVLPELRHTAWLISVTQRKMHN